MEEGTSVSKTRIGKPTRKRLPRKPRRRWEENIRMVLKEVGINPRSLLIRLRIEII